ncbi:TPA: DUF3165 family protein [Streptococcus suis]
MFYLILAMLLVLLYIFAAPNNIRGTINLMVAVFVLVALFIALLLAFLKVLEFSSHVWVAIIMFMIAFWAMWDIHHLDKPNTKRSSRTKRDTY